MGHLTAPWRRLLAFAVLLLAGLLPQTAQASVLPTGFEQIPVAEGLDQPTAVAWTPDGRVLVIEQPGRLKVVQPGSTTATTVLDITAKVNSYHDRGLLGLAVDSSFTTNRYIYLLYTFETNPLARDGGGKMVSQLARYRLNPDNTVTEGTVILGTVTTSPCPGPSDTVDCIPSEGLSHSIGTVRSAPDGTLFVGSGDAAGYSAVDTLALRTYDERSMAGKILHIDRNGRGLPGHAFCPSQTDLSRVCTKLYAKGFRNPFRFELHPDGGLLVGDVGWGTREELDVIKAPGGNYGWPCYEGKIRTGGYSSLSQCSAEYAKEGTADAHRPPVYDWPHNGGGAVVGGPMYRGDDYPAEYRDSIFLGDYAQAFIRRVKLDGSGNVASTSEFTDGWYGVDLEAAPNGDLVWVDYYGDAGGSVSRIVYSPGNAAPVARATATPTSGAPPLDVAFDARGSTDADGDLLTYRWDFGDGTSATGATPAKRYTAPGTYTVTLTASDGRGKTDTDTVRIDVGNSAPSVTISAPAAGLKYRDGVPVTLTGSATDPQDGALPASALRWRVVLRHDDHLHPVVDKVGVASTSFTPFEDHDADAGYEITLTARDAQGLETSVTRTIEPETTGLTLASEPAGAPLSYAGQELTAPAALTSAIGFKTSISAAETFTRDGVTYRFDRWSDGGARLHDVTIPATATTLTAVYKADAAAPRDGLVAAYGFDETSGTQAADGSGRGHTGTVSGAAWTTGGRHGGALRFDGVNDWVTVADTAALDLRAAMTLSAWVRPSDVRSWQTALAKEGAGTVAYALFATDGGTGTPHGAIEEAAAYAHGGITANAWTHLTMTSSGGTMRLYVDGELHATVPAPAPAATTGALRIGGNGVWPNEWFNGLIDDVRVYDRALTVDELRADMATGVGAGTVPPPPPPPTDGVVVDLKFDETSGGVAADSSGRGHDGTVAGAAWTASGKRGGALRFDGVDDMVTVRDHADLDLTSALTLEAWVRPDTLQAWQTVVAKDGPGDMPYGLMATAGGSPQPHANIGPFATYVPFGLTTGRWTHLAATYDGSRTRLYVDGVLAETGTLVAPPVTTTGALRVGGNTVWANEHFDGLIDEVRVWSRVLTSAEVAQRAGLAGTAALRAAKARGAERKAGGRPKARVRPACIIRGAKLPAGLAKRERAARRRGHRVVQRRRCAGPPHRKAVAGKGGGGQREKAGRGRSDAR